MTEELFSIRCAWNIEPPCYVRKVDRAGHWNPDEEGEGRIDSIQSSVFAPDDNNAVSVYRVSNDLDLVRVAVALNANRSSPIEGIHLESIYFLAMTANEVEGYDLQPTEGDTDCAWANHLHRDMIADNTMIRRLIERLLAAGRHTKKFTKSNMRHAVERAKQDGCHAVVPESKVCACEIQR